MEEYIVFYDLRIRSLTDERAWTLSNLGMLALTSH